MSEAKVPFIDLKQRFVEEREELLACVERVLAKGHVILTPEVRELEEAVEALYRRQALHQPQLGHGCAYASVSGPAAWARATR